MNEREKSRKEVGKNKRMILREEKKKKKNRYVGENYSRSIIG